MIMLDGTEDDRYTSPYITYKPLWYRDLDEYEDFIDKEDKKGKKGYMKNYIKNMELAIFLSLLVLVSLLKLLNLDILFGAIPLTLYTFGISSMIVISIVEPVCNDENQFTMYNIATILSQLLFIVVFYLAYTYPQARTLHWLWVYPLITLIVKMVLYGIIKFIVFLFKFDLDEDVHFKKDTKVYKLD